VLKRLTIVDDYTEFFSNRYRASTSTGPATWRMRAVIETWRWEYNEARPRGLGGLTLATYARQLTMKTRAPAGAPITAALRAAGRSVQRSRRDGGSDL
jgi:hypothetical protein